jgi:hypothetical protein
MQFLAGREISSKVLQNPKNFLCYHKNMTDKDKKLSTQLKNNSQPDYEKFFKQRLSELKQVLKEFLPCCLK